MKLNLTYEQKKMLKIGGIVVGCGLALIIIFMIISSIIGKKSSFVQIENTMLRAAKNYIADNPGKLTTEMYGITEITVSELVAGKYMKELSTYLDKGTSCTGSVEVFKNLEYVSYNAKLDCGDAYKYQLLKDVIINPNNIVTTGNGLYYNASDGSYLFRGEFVDNYVSFGGQTWLIIKIDEHGNIKLLQTENANYTVWDDRYNNDYEYDIGINDFEGVESSRYKDAIMNSYNNKKAYPENVRSLIIPQQWCIGKRHKNETNNTGYVECLEKSELIGAGGLYASEYFEASIDPTCANENTKSCANYNYLAKIGGTWTLTASADNTGQAFNISYTTIRLDNCSNELNYKLAIVVNGRVKYKSGKGTINSPYVIESIK